MISYNEIIENFPKDVQFPMMKLMDKLREEILDTVTKSDFRELRDTVYDLAKNIEALSTAQARTESRVDKLVVSVDNLTQAQEKTEQRLDNLTETLGKLAQAQEKTEQRLDKLAQAQEKTEQRLDKLAQAQEKTEQRLDKLAQAQEKTEQRLDKLAQAQEKTEQRLEKLAQAQEKTEETLRGVIKRQDKFSKELGGLANSFGYHLENEAIRFLPGILAREKGIDIQVMDRRFIVYKDGGDDELNIYGEGLLEGHKIYIVGESKSQVGKKDIDRFNKLLKRVSEQLQGEVYPLFITHSIHPDIKTYAKKMIQGLEIYKSYELKTKSITE